MLILQNFWIKILIRRSHCVSYDMQWLFFLYPYRKIHINSVQRWSKKMICPSDILITSDNNEERREQLLVILFTR